MDSTKLYSGFIAIAPKILAAILCAGIFFVVVISLLFAHEFSRLNDANLAIERAATSIATSATLLCALLPACFTVFLLEARGIKTVLPFIILPGIVVFITCLLAIVYIRLPTPILEANHQFAGNNFGETSANPRPTLTMRVLLVLFLPTSAGSIYAIMYFYASKLFVARMRTAKADPS